MQCLDQGRWPWHYLFINKTKEWHICWSIMSSIFYTEGSAAYIHTPKYFWEGGESKVLPALMAIDKASSPRLQLRNTADCQDCQQLLAVLAFLQSIWLMHNRKTIYKAGGWTVVSICTLKYNRKRLCFNNNTWPSRDKTSECNVFKLVPVEENRHCLGDGEELYRLLE